MKNKEVGILGEIIDNAAELPPDCQDWLLILAKGMAYTKKCLTDAQTAAAKTETA